MCPFNNANDGGEARRLNDSASSNTSGLNDSASSDSGDLKNSARRDADELKNSASSDSGSVKQFNCIEAIEWNDGIAHRTDYHQRRIEAAFRCLYTDYAPFRLEKELEKFREGGLHYAQNAGLKSEIYFPAKGKFKLRLEYDHQLRSIEFQEYHRREIRSLKLVGIQQFAMEYKSSERTRINQAFAQRGSCDDVLLVRDGLLTDTSYANIALYDGRKWISPRVPLLYGTRRAYLLDHQLMVTDDIRVDDLSRFQLLRMFNALIDFGEIEIPVESIGW